MRRKLARRLTIAALATVLAGLTTVSASGAFQIRCAMTPSAVATAPPIATVATAPFEDTSARLTDGANYYYGVYDALGQALDISLDKNPVTQAVRIGFDDGNPASAPVNAQRSTVVVTPATIQADGLQMTTITIAPKDANGVSLGRGLAVSIDATMLWPLRLTGGVVDLRDGTYRAKAVASIAGTGSVWVTVEGIVLATSPVVVATAADPMGSLRDLAIAQLSDLSSAGGPFSVLATQAGAGSPQAATLASAQSKALAMALALANGDPKRDDNLVKTNLDSLLGQLAGLLANPGTVNVSGVRNLMDDLLGVARLLAQYQIDLAAGRCGACNTQTHLPHSVCDAQDQLAAADALRAATAPNWSAAADTYARAIELALQTLQTC
jgi:Invasin, domain 3